MTPRVETMSPERLANTRAGQARRQRRYRAKAKRDAIDAYGGRCACCGETEIAFLCIDHVNGGGRKEKSKWAAFGSLHLYRDLRKRGWPPGYQVLCANCNMAKELADGCPHQRAKESVSG